MKFRENICDGKQLFIPKIAQKTGNVTKTRESGFTLLDYETLVEISRIDIICKYYLLIKKKAIF